MLVYRIEDNKGRGVCAATGSPYCHIYFSVSRDENEHCSFNHECSLKLMLAELRGINKHYAFPSLEALKSWFPNPAGRDKQQRYGAECHVYEVDDLIAKSPYQCVFDRDKAKLIKTLDLVTLEEKELAIA